MNRPSRMRNPAARGRISEDRTCGLSGSVDRVNLERACRTASAGYRSIFVLHDVQGYEHNEIATIMKCSIGNSKSQLHKARMRLRELLQETERDRAREERQAAKGDFGGQATEEIESRTDASVLEHLETTDEGKENTHAVHQFEQILEQHSDGPLPAAARPSSRSASHAAFSGDDLETIRRAAPRVGR